ncbi:hypothetical protein J7M22_11205 [Candidatus Poribacteria bacterium]|nr:hypothetical protein [Candidatus Poribacteria bacterium]
MIPASYVKAVVIAVLLIGISKTGWGFDILSSARLRPGERHVIRFDAPRTPTGLEVVLMLKARLDNPKVAGYNAASRLWLNGRPIGGKRLLDRPQIMTIADGRALSAAQIDNLYVPYAPDFEATDRDPSYALRGVKACQFTLRVTDLLREGENELVIQNAGRGGIKHVLVIADGRIEYRAPVKPKPETKVAFPPLRGDRLHQQLCPLAPLHAHRSRRSSDGAKRDRRIPDDAPGARLRLRLLLVS